LTSSADTPARVEPDVYTDEYYLTNCHGYEEFVASGGRQVGARFKKALALAGNLRGKRVLDVGCGRGELIIQSAMRGGDAWGIDYAEAAVQIARGALGAVSPEVQPRTHAEQMDIKALRFDDAFFDVVFMLDVVEHLYPDELRRAFDELRRVICPGGRLILHTSPNTLFERVVYPNYSRRVNQAALAVSRRLRFSDGLFNETMLPTSGEFPHDTYERTMHINEQSLAGLKRQVEDHGFRVAHSEYWEPPRAGGYFSSRRLNVELALLDFVRFLRPLSAYPPLNRFFCNHMWLVAERI
jgi:cyclopropane fatty-acyl-phospholipid synthase-like methyltransferase